MPNPFLDATVLIAIITVVGTISTAIINNLFGTRRKDIQERLNDIQERLSNISFDLTTKGEQINRIEQNSKDITRYRLYHDMTRDIMQGCTTLEKKREIAKLYKSYVMLGGNGEIELLYKNDFSKLIIKKENEYES